MEDCKQQLSILIRNPGKIFPNLQDLCGQFQPIDDLKLYNFKMYLCSKLLLSQLLYLVSLSFRLYYTPCTIINYLNIRNSVIIVKCTDPLIDNFFFTFSVVQSSAKETELLPSARDYKQACYQTVEACLRSDHILYYI